MPRRFRRNWKPIVAPRKTEYLKYPVGSNEWTRQKNIEFEERKRAKEAANAKEKSRK